MESAAIGDSWARRVNLPGVRVHAFPGATSKKIYENLPVVFDVEAVFVIAGINDSALSLGPSFYVRYMTLIVAALKERGIRPVVLEIPDYRVTISPRNPLIYIRKLFIGGSLEDYRKALRQALPDIELVRFDSKPEHFAKDLLHPSPAGAAHLNDVLAHCQK